MLSCTFLSVLIVTRLLRPWAVRSSLQAPSSFPSFQLGGLRLNLAYFPDGALTLERKKLRRLLFGVSAYQRFDSLGRNEAILGNICTSWDKRFLCHEATWPATRKIFSIKDVVCLRYDYIVFTLKQF